MGCAESSDAPPNVVENYGLRQARQPSEHVTSPSSVALRRCGRTASCSSSTHSPRAAASPDPDSLIRSSGEEGPPAESLLLYGNNSSDNCGIDAPPTCQRKKAEFGEGGTVDEEEEKEDVSSFSPHSPCHEEGGITIGEGGESPLPQGSHSGRHSSLVVLLSSPPSDSAFSLLPPGEERQPRRQPIQPATDPHHPPSSSSENTTYLSSTVGSCWRLKGSEDEEEEDEARRRSEIRTLGDFSGSPRSPLAAADGRGPSPLPEHVARALDENERMFVEEVRWRQRRRSLQCGVLSTTDDPTDLSGYSNLMRQTASLMGDDPEELLSESGDNHDIVVHSPRSNNSLVGSSNASPLHIPALPPPILRDSFRNLVMSPANDASGGFSPKEESPSWRGSPQASPGRRRKTVTFLEGQTTEQ